MTDSLSIALRAFSSPVLMSFSVDGENSKEEPK